jgi:hypothetical protein
LIVIAKYIDKSKVKKYSKQLVILIVIAYLLLFTGSLYTMAKTVLSIFGYGTKFVETVYATSQAYKITHKITYMMEIGLFFVFFNYIFSRAVRKYKNSIRTNKMIETENNMSLMIFCYKVNYILLLILPLAWFSGDIYRIQHGILILFYSAFSNSNYMYSKKKAGITLYQLAIILFIAVFMLLFLIGLSSLRETVFMPVFFENELIG